MALFSLRPVNLLSSIDTPSLKFTDLVLISLLHSHHWHQSSCITCITAEYFELFAGLPTSSSSLTVLQDELAICPDNAAPLGQACYAWRISHIMESS